MNRSEKEELVSELNGIFTSAKSVIVVHYKGLSVAQIEELRNITSKADMGFKVIKNSLASLALRDTQNSVLDEFLVGPSAIAWGEDPVSCAKLVNDFAKKNQHLAIIGGAYNSSKLSAADVNTLATLPSFDELRGKLVGLLTAAATKVAVITRTPATNVIGVLKAYSEKA
ncbi:MAG: 50S ribosomal protein L10 [Alphaproteobacteria bacterium]|nr:50S ribosomal protein L10 [Alphaproteobacteria bacterium]